MSSGILFNLQRFQVPLRTGLYAKLVSYAA
jgi:hypothetical protein